MRASRESKWMAAPASPPVVVLGAGFAGLRAVRRLGRAGVGTLWVDAHNYHCFLPLLYQVATAGLEPQEIAYPARSILRRLRAVDFRLARVVAGDPAARSLETTAGERIAYSHLIVCTGGAAEDFGIPGVREHAFHLYDLDDARALRNHVLRTLERAAVCADPVARAALLTFVIVGAGATGVEMGGALAEFRRHVVPRDYRTVDPAGLRLIVLEAGQHVLPPYPPELRERARRDLEAFGVEVRTGCRVERVAGDHVELGGGHPRGAGRGAARAPDRAERAPLRRADAPGPRLPDGVRRRRRGLGRGCGAPAPGGAGGHPAGRARGRERAARAARRAAPSLPLRRQGRHGDHRAEPRRGGRERRAPAGPPRLVGLARRPPGHADRVPQSPGRAGELGVELLHLRPRAARHRRRGGRGGRVRDESARTRLTRRARGQGAARTLRGVDLNHRPRGYEPRELPGCSTPRQTARREATIRRAVTLSRSLQQTVADT